MKASGGILKKVDRGRCSHFFFLKPFPKKLAKLFKLIGMPL